MSLKTEKEISISMWTWSIYLYNTQHRNLCFLRETGLLFLFFFSYPYLTTFELIAKVELSEILNSAKRAFTNHPNGRSELYAYQTPGNVHSFPKHGFLGSQDCSQGSQGYLRFVNVLAFSLDDGNLQDKLFCPGRFLCCFGLFFVFFFFNEETHAHHHTNLHRSMLQGTKPCHQLKSAQGGQEALKKVSLPVFGE